MKDAILNPIHVPLQSLALAAVIHLAVFNIFIFSFPVTTESFKPQFVFLGAILNDQDIREGHSVSAVPLSEDQISQTSVFLKPAQKQSSSSLWGNSKPSDSHQTLSSPKQHIKTTFDIKPPKTKNVEEKLQEIGVEIDTTTYKPLTLSPHDQN